MINEKAKGIRELLVATKKLVLRKIQVIFVLSP